MTKKRSWNIDLLSLLRYGILGVLLVYIIVLLHQAGGSSVPYETVEKAVEGVLDTEELDRADSQDLKRLYGINEREVDGALLYYQKATMGVEEVLLVRAFSEREAQEIAETAQERRDIQIENFEGYGPEQVKLLKDSILRVKGNYVLFVVSPDAETVEKAFRKAL